MAFTRQLFGVEIGIHLISKDDVTGVAILFGSPAPGGETFTDDAEQGSLYLRTSGQVWYKYASGSGTNKWKRMANYDDVLAIRWRSENVIAVTSTAAPSEDGTIDLDANPLGGDEAPLLTGADFVAGDCILFGYGGTEVIARITDVTGDVLTFTLDSEDANYPIPALGAGDVFMVDYYLPDSPDGQEKQAIVLFNGTDYIKIADFNWELATGIHLSGAYAAAAGNPGAGDTVEAAIAKIDGNVDAINSAMGIAQGATNMGAYSGTILTDNSTTKNNIQELETYLDQMPHGGRGSADGFTAETTIDQIKVDTALAAHWWVVISLDSDPTQRIGLEVFATHDGTAAADAVNVDNTVFAKLKLGATPPAHVVKVDLNGAGTSQYMRLRVSATAAVSVRSTRIDVMA